jgi:hypothetical protein
MRIWVTTSARLAATASSGPSKRIALEGAVVMSRTLVDSTGCAAFGSMRSTGVAGVATDVVLPVASEAIVSAARAIKRSRSALLRSVGIAVCGADEPSVPVAPRSEASSA